MPPAINRNFSIMNKKSHRILSYLDSNVLPLSILGRGNKAVHLLGKLWNITWAWWSQFYFSIVEESVQTWGGIVSSAWRETIWNFQSIIRYKINVVKATNIFVLKYKSNEEVNEYQHFNENHCNSPWIVSSKQTIAKKKATLLSF